MKLHLLVRIGAIVSFSASSYGQMSYNLIQQFSVSPTVYYCGSTSGYFYSLADVEGPGGGSASNIGGCTWQAAIGYTGQEPGAQALFKIQLTDEATAY